jgi:hypothetical protein
LSICVMVLGGSLLFILPHCQMSTSALSLSLSPPSIVIIIVTV